MLQVLCLAKYSSAGDAVALNNDNINTIISKYHFSITFIVFVLLSTPVRH